MTGAIINFGRPSSGAFDVAARIGEVRGVAVEIWREIRLGGGLRVVLTPTHEGFSVVALFPPDTLHIAERLAHVVMLTLEAADKTWRGGD